MELSTFTPLVYDPSTGLAAAAALRQMDLGRWVRARQILDKNEREVHRHQAARAQSRIHSEY
jgi:hypothetical protein